MWVQLSQRLSPCLQTAIYLTCRMHRRLLMCRDSNCWVLSCLRCSFNVKAMLDLQVVVHHGVHNALIIWCYVSVLSMLRSNLVRFKVLKRGLLSSIWYLHFSAGLLLILNHHIALRIVSHTCFCIHNLSLTYNLGFLSFSVSIIFALQHRFEIAKSFNLSFPIILDKFQTKSYWWIKIYLLLDHSGLALKLSVHLNRGMSRICVFFYCSLQGHFSWENTHGTINYTKVFDAICRIGSSSLIGPHWHLGRIDDTGVSVVLIWLLFSKWLTSEIIKTYHFMKIFKINLSNKIQD